MVVLVVGAIVLVVIVLSISHRHPRPAPVCYARPNRACPVTTGR